MDAHGYPPGQQPLQFSGSFSQTNHPTLFAHSAFPQTFNPVSHTPIPAWPPRQGDIVANASFQGTEQQWINSSPVGAPAGRLFGQFLTPMHAQSQWVDNPPTGSSIDASGPPSTPIPVANHGARPSVRHGDPGGDPSNSMSLDNICGGPQRHEASPVGTHAGDNFDFNASPSPATVANNQDANNLAPGSRVSQNSNTTGQTTAKQTPTKRATPNGTKRGGNQDPNGPISLPALRRILFDFKDDLVRWLGLVKEEQAKKRAGDDQDDNKLDDYAPGCVVRTLLTPRLAVETFDNHRGLVVASMVAQNRNDPGWSRIKRIQVKSTTVQFIFRTPADAAMFVPDRARLAIALGTEVKTFTLHPEMYYVQVKFKGKRVKKHLAPDVSVMFQDLGVEIESYRTHRGDLILHFKSREMAWKLISQYEKAKETFQIDFAPAEVRGIDIRSIPCSCHRCWDAGHMRAQCVSETPVCGLCSSTDHESRDCTSTDFHCPNCGEDHAAWDNSCTNSNRIKELQRTAGFYGLEPYWVVHSRREEQAAEETIRTSSPNIDDRPRSPTTASNRDQSPISDPFVSPRASMEVDPSVQAPIAPAPAPASPRPSPATTPTRSRSRRQSPQLKDTDSTPVPPTASDTRGRTKIPSRVSPRRAVSSSVEGNPTSSSISENPASSSNKDKRAGSHGNIAPKRFGSPKDAPSSKRRLLRTPSKDRNLATPSTSDKGKAPAAPSTPSSSASSRRGRSTAATTSGPSNAPARREDPKSGSPKAPGRRRGASAASRSTPTSSSPPSAQPNTPASPVRQARTPSTSATTPGSPSGQRVASDASGSSRRPSTEGDVATPGAPGRQQGPSAPGSASTDPKPKDDRQPRQPVPEVSGDFRGGRSQRFYNGNR